MAKVGGRSLTVDELAAQVQAQGQGAVRRLNDHDRLLRYVEDQVRFELLVQAARERGLDRDPEVIDAAQKVMVQKLLQHDMGASVFEPVPDTAIAEYYEQHRDEYVQMEKRRFAEIQLAHTDEGLALAQTLLEQLVAKPKDKELIRTLATQHSRKKKVRIGLDDLFQSREELAAEYGEAFAKAIFEAPADHLIPTPLESSKGWHVVQMLAVREPLSRDLWAVREEIRDKLQRSERSGAFDEYLRELKKRYPVALYEGRIEALRRALDPAAESAAEATP